MNGYGVRRAAFRDTPTLADQRHSMFADMRDGSGSELEVHDKAFPGWASRQVRMGRLHGYPVEAFNGEVVGWGSGMCSPSLDSRVERSPT